MRFFASVASFFILQLAALTFASARPDDCGPLGETGLVCPNVDAELAYRLRERPILSFSNSQWIWTPEVTSSGKAPPGSRAFRRTFIAPHGKTPAFVTVAFGADDAATLWVNGEPLATEVGWGHARSFCAPLRPHLNVFAVNATNNGNVNNAAGFLLTAIITYMDGSTSALVSDTTWRSETNVPGGFAELAFDDSAWLPVKSTGEYTTDAITIAGQDDLSFMSARWIWTGELAEGNAPPGARAFRLTVTLPPSHTSARATILATADDYYSFYVNGRFVGSGIQSMAAQRFEVEDIEGPQLVFTIYAENKVVPEGWNPAGLIAAIRVSSQSLAQSCVHGCSLTSDWFTDSVWKTYPGDAPPYGFELPGFDDSNWPYAMTRARLPGRISVPNEITEPGSPLPGAPRGIPSSYKPVPHYKLQSASRLQQQSDSFHHRSSSSQSQYSQTHFDDGDSDTYGGSRYPPMDPRSAYTDNLRPSGSSKYSGRNSDEHVCECSPVNGAGPSRRMTVNIS